MTYTSHHSCRGNLHVFTFKKALALHPGTLKTLLDPPELVKNPVVDGFKLIDEGDFYPKTSFIDIALRGSVHTPGGQPTNQLTVGFEVQDIQHQFLAIGQRHLQKSSGTWSFSDPEPFTSIPLTWEEAYGGHDHLCDKEGDLCGLEALSEQTGRDLEHLNLSRYRRNPYGKGFILTLKPEHDGFPLPRIEPAHDLMTPTRIETGTPINWHFQPIPACFDWIHFHWFPRACFMVEKLFGKVGDLVPQKKLPEYDYGYSRQDLFERLPAHELIRHPRMFNSAHPALQVPNKKRDISLTFWNLHPQWPEWSIKIPYQEAKIAMTVPGERKTYKETTHLSQVLIDIPNEVVTATWHAIIHSHYPITEENHSKIKYDVNWHPF